MISVKSYTAPPELDDDDDEDDASSVVSSDEDMDDDPFETIDSSPIDEVDVDDAHFSSS